MRLVLCTLCLNEMEWLPKLYEQHRCWPGLLRWIFVEAADVIYAQTNPSLVSDKGLSVDGTSDFLRDLARQDGRVEYIPFGFSRHEDPALCKVPARQAYLDAVEPYHPDFLVILDTDEFYTYAGQEKINETFRGTGLDKHCYCFQFTHIWHPACLASEPLFQYEVCGGFWGMRHMKGIRWTHRLRYTNNHQRPEAHQGWGKLVFFEQPHCFHMAFASNLQTRVAKHAYYATRGEAVDHRRCRYVASRKCFEDWRPGQRLPKGAEVRPYTGDIPEVFR